MSERVVFLADGADPVPSVQPVASAPQAPMTAEATERGAAGGAKGGAGGGRRALHDGTSPDTPIHEENIFSTPTTIVLKVPKLAPFRDVFLTLDLGRRATTLAVMAPIFEPDFNSLGPKAHQLRGLHVAGDKATLRLYMSPDFQLRATDYLWQEECPMIDRAAVTLAHQHEAPAAGGAGRSQGSSLAGASTTSAGGDESAGPVQSHLLRPQQAAAHCSFDLPFGPTLGHTGATAQHLAAVPLLALENLSGKFFLSVYSTTALANIEIHCRVNQRRIRPEDDIRHPWRISRMFTVGPFSHDAFIQWFNTHKTQLMLGATRLVEPNTGMNPLHVALGHLADPRIVRLMIKHCGKYIKANVADAEGQTPLFKLLRRADVYDPQSAGYFRALDLLQVLAVDADASLDLQDTEGNTLTHFAARHHVFGSKIMRRLLELGAPPDTRNWAGRTPEQEADHYGGGVDPVTGTVIPHKLPLDLREVKQLIVACAESKRRAQREAVHSLSVKVQREQSIALGILPPPDADGEDPLAARPSLTVDRHDESSSPVGGRPRKASVFDYKESSMLSIHSLTDAQDDGGEEAPAADPFAHMSPLDAVAIGTGRPPIDHTTQAASPRDGSPHGYPESAILKYKRESERKAQRAAEAARGYLEPPPPGTVDPDADEATHHHRTMRIVPAEEKPPMRTQWSMPPLLSAASDTPQNERALHMEPVRASKRRRMPKLVRGVRPTTADQDGAARDGSSSDSGPDIDDAAIPAEVLSTEVADRGGEDAPSEEHPARVLPPVQDPSITDARTHVVLSLTEAVKGHTGSMFSPFSQRVRSHGAGLHAPDLVLQSRDPVIKKPLETARSYATYLASAATRDISAEIAESQSAPAVPRRLQPLAGSTAQQQDAANSLLNTMHRRRTDQQGPGRSVRECRAAVATAAANAKHAPVAGTVVLPSYATLARHVQQKELRAAEEWRFALSRQGLTGKGLPASLRPESDVEELARIALFGDLNADAVLEANGHRIVHPDLRLLGGFAGSYGLDGHKTLDRDSGSHPRGGQRGLSSPGGRGGFAETILSLERPMLLDEDCEVGADHADHGPSLMALIQSYQRATQNAAGGSGAQHSEDGDGPLSTHQRIAEAQRQIEGGTAIPARELERLYSDYERLVAESGRGYLSAPQLASHLKRLDPMGVPVTDADMLHIARLHGILGHRRPPHHTAMPPADSLQKKDTTLLSHTRGTTGTGTGMGGGSPAPGAGAADAVDFNGYCSVILHFNRL